MKKLLLGVLVGVVLIASGCDEDNDINGPATDYSTKDLEGTWLGIMTLNDGDGDRERVTGFVFDSLGNLTDVVGDRDISTDGALAVTKEGIISGTIQVVGVNDHGHEETSSVVCQGSFSSSTVIQLGGAWTWSDDGGHQGSGTMSCVLDKEGFEYSEAELAYWPNSTDKWWLQFHVYAKGASRVYVTGQLIEGQYDLYRCGSWGYCDYWWSSNDPQCVIGSNNYHVGPEPALPFNVTVHVVRSAGETTRTLTISSYETYE